MTTTMICQMPPTLAALQPSRLEQPSLAVMQAPTVLDRHTFEAFMDKAAQATLLGSVFDDAATGQGLLNFFLRGLASGAISEAEVEATGLSVAELRTRSFAAILDRRRAGATVPPLGSRGR